MLAPMVLAWAGGYAIESEGEKEGGAAGSQSELPHAEATWSALWVSSLSHRGSSLCVQATHAARRPAETPRDRELPAVGKLGLGDASAGNPSGAGRGTGRGRSVLEGEPSSGSVKTLEDSQPPIPSSLALGT